MHRPFLSLVACVTFAACSRSPVPAAAPDPSPAPSPLPAPETPAPLQYPVAPGTAVEREYHGAYTRGFEASWFAPCGALMDDALWWVTLTEDARLQRDSLLAAVRQPPTGALAVRWRGTTSSRLRAGHMGRGTRYLLVTAVLEVRPLPAEGACGSPSRSS